MGNVKKIYRSVDVTKHAQEILGRFDLRGGTPFLPFRFFPLPPFPPLPYPPLPTREGPQPRTRRHEAPGSGSAPCFFQAKLPAAVSLY